MKILIIKSVFVIALMLLITPLNAQSLKPLSQAKRDSILISIAKKVLQKEAPEYLLEYGKPIISERKIRRMTQEEEKAVPDFSPLHGAKSERIYYIVEFPPKRIYKAF
ncbi:hypothetical protein NXW84_21815 [Bacteroides fragilis]|nr:hypothetical protein NXW84_21815 [Bacteroides fragilis]